MFMELLELGIAAAKANNRTEARMYLEAATLTDPNSEQGFLWLSFVLEDRKLAMRCLERVLEINPANEQAKRGLAWLRSQEGAKGLPIPQRLTDAEMKAMLEALRHTDEQIVVKAIQRLGQSGDGRVVDPLIRLMLAGKTKLIQSQSRAALIAIGTPAIEPVLKRMLVETNSNVASQLGAILARVRSMAALAACREVVETAKNPVARYAMALNLTASSHGEAGLNIVRDYLANAKEDERARLSVLASFGQAIKGGVLDATQGIKFLVEIKGDQYLPPALRRGAITALGASSQQAAVRYLLEATNDKETETRIAAVDALAKFTPPQVAILEKLARSPDQAVRARANQILDYFQAAQKKKA
jgi:HEAT repeat protein